MTAMLELEALSVSYGAVRAVREVDLHVEHGEIVALLGANGAGKSTTLGGVMGMLRKAGGRVRLDGEDITGHSTDRIVRAGMTLVPEGRRVFSSLTVSENLAAGAAGVGDPRVARRRREEMLELFPVLAERQGQLASAMSGGEQQQLAIARALMSGPHLLLLDEPSLGLAPIIVDAVFGLMRDLRANGLTVLLVEQNVGQALEIADRAYVLRAGELALSGRPQELLESSALERTYLGLEVT